MQDLEAEIEYISPNNRLLCFLYHLVYPVTSTAGAERLVMLLRAPEPDRNVVVRESVS